MSFDWKPFGWQTFGQDIYERDLLASWQKAVSPVSRSNTESTKCSWSDVGQSNVFWTKACQPKYLSVKWFLMKWHRISWLLLLHLKVASYQQSFLSDQICWSGTMFKNFIFSPQTGLWSICNGFVSSDQKPFGWQTFGQDRYERDLLASWQKAVSPVSRSNTKSTKCSWSDVGQSNVFWTKACQPKYLSVKWFLTKGW